MTSDAFRELLADEWEFRLREDPLFATFAGDHRYDDRLPSAGEVGYARRLEGWRGFRNRLRSMSRDGLPAGDRLDHDLFGRYLDVAIGFIEFRAYRMPISRTSGFHTQFPEVHLHMPLASPEDYGKYIRRLEAFRGYVGDHIEAMRAGLREGQVPPRVTLEGVDASIRALVVEDPAASPLEKPFSAFPGSVGPEDRGRLRGDGLSAIERSVTPGYADLLAFVVDEYLPRSRSTISATSLPNGRAYYAFCIRRYTTLDLAPEDIHDTGIREVTRIRAEMEDAVRRTEFRGTFPEFVDHLRTEPRFYAKTPEDLMKETALVLKRIDGELPRLFRTLPRMPYGILEVPAYKAPGTTTAYYERPAGDGTRAGFYYVNTSDLPSRPLYEIEALSLHEAVPGHHLQIALQQELGDLPPFRRFANFTAFIEGWALYAERLGLEMGFFTDPYSDFARLSYEMWRACRLVVDTGMHALGWTRERAIAFMAENTSSTLLNITNEVDRYIAWPGQALAYKIGELKIRELRGRAERALGPLFDVREFHDIVLRNGAIPLDVLNELVTGWIDSGSTAGVDRPVGEPPQRR